MAANLDSLALGERHAHARLQNAIAAHDAAAHRIVLGAVERMGDRSDQRRGGRSRQDGVGVERDDIAHAAQPRQVAFRDRERIIVRAADERVELDELSALALPPHPHAIGRIPSSRPMQQIERRIVRRVAPDRRSRDRVRGVQRANAGDGRFDDRCVPAACSVGESRRSLSSANRICGSRFARYWTSR